MGVGDTYPAANGHIMEVTEVRWDGTKYVAVQWNAEHADECPCEGLVPLEDW